MVGVPEMAWDLGGPIKNSWTSEARIFQAPKEDEDVRFDGAPFRLNDIMSRRRFEEILSVHVTHTVEQPSFVDPFHPVRELFDAWNDNIKLNFVPSWVVCLDESMSLWTNMYTCPGFVFCPRKPWKTGNEYHTIACGLSSIIFHVEMVEGKCRPNELGPPKYEDHGGKIVGLLLRMTKSILNTGCVVVLDSGFCVLMVLVALEKHGLFAHASIKKCRYWPKYICGDAIKSHFAGKPVGFVDALPGTLDGVPFYVFAMKEPDYVMSVMSTYGTLNSIDGSTTKRIWKDDNNEDKRATFNYTEVSHNHFAYRHVVDDNNNIRMQPFSIEMTWLTKEWRHRAYAFPIGVSVVNAQKARENLGEKEQISTLKFRTRLAKEMISNRFIPGQEKVQTRAKRRKFAGCDLVSLPPYNAFRGNEIIEVEGNYNQCVCLCKKNRVRTYCECSPGIILMN